MTLPRWTVYPALVVLGAFAFLAVPRGGSEDPLAGVAAAARARGVAAASGEAEAAAVPQRKTAYPRVVVLGIDGLDPDILGEVIERYPERMPNFRWLIAQGSGIHDLGTSCPPQSPVAWSNFITGLNPGGHGIFDFIHRDPKTYKILGSTTKTTSSSEVPLPGKWRFPIGGDSVSNRSGDSFWKLLREAGVPADIWRMPANFPVEPSKGLSFPGMMTPALDSAYGECSFYTTNTRQRIELTEHSDKVYQLNGSQDVYDAALFGPDNPFIDPSELEGAAKGTEKARVPLRIFVDHESGAAAIQVDGDHTLVLRPGQWSDFVEVHYHMLPLGAMDMSGIVRFYLRSIDPDVELYASPVNLDPLDPPTPVSQPTGASAQLAEAIGLYYTQGMAENVNALKEHILTDDEFMHQVNLVFTERERMMDYALDRYAKSDQGGLLFFYYSTVDLTCHMMWRHSDPVHPYYDPEIAGEDSSWWSHRPGSTWKDVISDLYMKMDPVLGRIREKLGEDETLIVMSDHGFAPFRREFGLNRWLWENGYLVLKDGMQPEQGEYPGDAGKVEIWNAVDWSKTKAYGIGFNGLYLNRQGREEDGIVRPDQVDELLAKLKRELEAVRDPDYPDARPILRVDLAKDVYSGPRVDEAPDALVGYNVGYGNSDETSLGRVTYAVFKDNDGGNFNGNHLMAPDVVAGTLISNRPVLPGDHDLTDLTVEILARFGVEPTPEMKGHRVLE